MILKCLDTPSSSEASDWIYENVEIQTLDSRWCEHTGQIWDANPDEKRSELN